MENRKRLIELLETVRYTTNDIEKVAAEICYLFDDSKYEAICNCKNEYWKEDEGGDWYCTIHDNEA